MTDLGAGNVHTCVALADGTARCWGQNAFGQLGNAAARHLPVPVRPG